MKSASPDRLWMLALGLFVLGITVSGLWFATTRQDESGAAANLRSSPVSNAEAQVEGALAGMGPRRRESRAALDPASDLDSTAGAIIIVDLDAHVSDWRADTPAPHSRIEIGVGPPSDLDSPVLAEVVTDERGRARAELSWERIEQEHARNRDEIWVRVKQPGFARSWCVRPLPTEPSTIEFRVPLYSGTELVGRLLDREGQPVAGKVTAWVVGAGRLFSHEPRVTVGAKDYPILHKTMVEEHGWFGIHLRQPGRYQLRGESPDHGTAVILDVPIELDVLREPLFLRCAGPGVLCGQVIDGAGTPAAGLELRAILAELDDGKGGRELPGARTNEIALEGRGHHRRMMVTDAKGRFELQGMREGLFLIRARTTSSYEYPILLTPTPVASDGVRLELRLDRPHLVVRLKKTDPNQVFGAVEIEHTAWWMEPAPDEWPETLTLSLCPVGREAATAGVPQYFLPGKRVADDEFVFEVSGDRRYQVGVRGPGIEWRPRQLSIPSDRTRTEVILEFPAESPSGELEVTAHAPDGTVLEEDVRIQVRDVNTGLPLVHREPWEFDPWPTRFRLPEGRYSLVVESAEFYDDHHGVLLSPREYGRFQTPIEVVRDRSTRVAARLPAGARLRLNLVGDATEVDRGVVRSRFEWNDDDAEFVEHRSRQVTIHLLGEREYPQPIWFIKDWEDRDDWFHDEDFTTRPSVGREVTSQPLPAGEYLLEGCLPGGRRATQKIVLIDGQTTDATLRFAE